jgi:hypothetical protein
VRTKAISLKENALKMFYGRMQFQMAAIGEQTFFFEISAN